MKLSRKTGAWYAYNDEKIGQGRENAKAFLKKNPDKLESVVADVKSFLGMNPEEKKKLKRKIKSINRRGKKHPKRLITFDDKSVFELSEDVFVSVNLDLGSVVDENYLKRT